MSFKTLAEGLKIRPKENIETKVSEVKIMKIHDMTSTTHLTVVPEGKERKDSQEVTSDNCGSKTSRFMRDTMPQYTRTVHLRQLCVELHETTET